tara:strand:+ start:77 stop:205 length:129 start_codon:yes stop_codon:yes gene_type:complete
VSPKKKELLAKHKYNKKPALPQQKYNETKNLANIDTQATGPK